MTNNKGITIITLVITIIVIVLIASITIFTGLNTVESIRLKEANDIVNAIHLALIANESNIPSGLNDGKYLINTNEINDRELTNDDFEIMGLDYTVDDCIVVLDKSMSGDDTLIYNYTYTNSMGKTFDEMQYVEHFEVSKTNTSQEFDTNRGVNRPVLSEEEMIPLSGDSKVNNVYTENWYNYKVNISRYALMSYKDNIYAWIPRFAYKIQNFYIGKAYSNTPSTAIDIVFLREGTDYMSNGEVLPSGYEVHPAFENGSSGFWIMVNPYDGRISGIEDAIDGAKIDGSEKEIGHLLKNSEYAATALLSKFLNNNDIIYNDKEYVAAIYSDVENAKENFDVYSSVYGEINYIGNIKGHALTDTPWDMDSDARPQIPELAFGTKYLMRNAAKGMFYYEVTDGAENANYRSVIIE